MNEEIKNKNIEEVEDIQTTFNEDSIEELNEEGEVENVVQNED